MKVRDGIKFGFGVTIGWWLAANVITAMTKCSIKISGKTQKENEINGD